MVSIQVPMYKVIVYSFIKKTITNNDIDFPVLESVFKVNDISKKGCSNAIGYINNDSNNVQQQNVIHIFTAVCKANGNKPITPNNFDRAMVTFSSRKMIRKNWVQWYDEFLKPNVEHKEFKQFTYDSIVYSLFENKSYQSSLRNINYKNQQWNINNEFFWLSKDDMIELANNNEYDELYRDARGSNNRYVYLKLFGEGVYDLLSDDAKEVLDMATELVKKSMSMRKVMSDTNPEYHLNSWDAGYAQLKLVWKTYYKDDFDAFRKAYTRLEDRMRPLVYELGFLK